MGLGGRGRAGGRYVPWLLCAVAALYTPTPVWAEFFPPLAGCLADPVITEGKQWQRANQKTLPSDCCETRYNKAFTVIRPYAHTHG